MAEIVNLRRVKKQRARDAAAQTAAENRVRHGRTGAARAADQMAHERARAALDGRRKEPADTQP